MIRKALFTICCSVLAAGVIYSSLQTAKLSQRVTALERKQTVAKPKPALSPLVVSSIPAKIAPKDQALCKVLKVIDGDTVVLETENGPVKTRIIGIDTPETLHPSKPIEYFGPEASERAKSLLSGKTIKIQYDPDPKHDTWGKYGRLLVYIELDGKDFGLLMIQAGFAKAYPKYPFSRAKEYLAAEQAAKKVHAGMWKKTN
jgi:micrococcal nuclease